MAERKAVTAAIRSRYRRASKKEKGKILAEFIELTGYHRVYARSVLRTVARKLVQGQPTPAESKSATEKSRKYGWRDGGSADLSSHFKSCLVADGRFGYATVSASSFTKFFAKAPFRQYRTARLITIRESISHKLLCTNNFLPYSAQNHFAPNLDNAQRLFLIALTCLSTCNYNHFFRLPRDSSTEVRVLEKLLLDRAFQISINSTSRYQPSLLDTADSLKR